LLSSQKDRSFQMVSVLGVTSRNRSWGLVKGVQVHGVTFSDRKWFQIEARLFLLYSEIRVFISW
jgi:hypothetical protein